MTMTTMRRNLLITALLLISTLLHDSFVSGRAMQSLEYAGNWQLLEASQDLVLQEIPPGRTITLKMEEQDSNRFGVSIKIANIFMSSIQIMESTSEGGYTIQAGPVASTRMMPPPDLEPLEYFVADRFPQLTTMNIVNNILILQGGGVEMKWEKPNDYNDAE